MNDIKELTELVVRRDGFNKVLPIFEREEYIKYHNHKFYCEILILSDGRIVEAHPSHMYALSALIKAVSGKELEDLDYSYYEEDMRYYSQAVVVYYRNQACFSEESITEEQIKTLDALDKKGILEKQVSYYSSEFIEHYKMITGKDK